MPNSHLGPNSVFSPPDNEIGCPSKVKDTKSKGLTHTNGDLAAQLSLPDCWIADTGCGHDLLAKRWVDEADKARLFESSSPLLFTGVGGEVPAKLKLLLHSAKLGKDVEPYVLDETPDVLSIGMRCVEHGWSFWWPPYSVHPILTPTTGE